MSGVFELTVRVSVSLFQPSIAPISLLLSISLFSVDIKKGWPEVTDEVASNLIVSPSLTYIINSVSFAFTLSTM